MGEQRKLTEENVDELRERLKEMSIKNRELSYTFFKQTDQKLCPDCNEYWSPKTNFCGSCGIKL